MAKQSNEAIWIGWGVSVLAIGAGLVFGGPFWGWLLMSAGAAIALRGHFPQWFTRRVEPSRLVSADAPSTGRIARSDESVRAWLVAAAVVVSVSVAAFKIQIALAPATFLFFSPVPSQLGTHWMLKPILRGRDTLYHVEVKIDDQEWPSTLIPGGPARSDVFKMSRALTYPEIGPNGKGLLNQGVIWQETPYPVSARWMIDISHRRGIEAEQIVARKHGNGWVFAIHVWDVESKQDLIKCRDALFPEVAPFTGKLKPCIPEAFRP